MIVYDYASNEKQIEQKSIHINVSLVLAESLASGNCIRNTVAALMNKGDTISAAEISNDIRKQREREMNVLLNRFNRPNESVEPENSQHVRAEPVVSRPVAPAGTSVSAAPPPPPPPPQQQQQHVETKCIVKRKSIGEWNVVLKNVIK